ncbi:MAG: HEPN domain-containing protein [Bacteroidales bacterium]|nr:HEPN domain-containing protein [Bacteroidales bacterium]
MVKKDKIQYWIDLSDYDLETANAMLKSTRYLYVGFMCHQTIEKALKGYFASLYNDIPPFTHNLAFLIVKTGLDNELTEDQKALVDELEPLNIEARYPEYKERLLKQLTKDKCLELINKTTALQQWIKRKLSER